MAEPVRVGIANEEPRPVSMSVDFDHVAIHQRLDIQDDVVVGASHKDPLKWTTTDYYALQTLRNRLPVVLLNTVWQFLKPSQFVLLGAAGTWTCRPTAVISRSHFTVGQVGTRFIVKYPGALVTLPPVLDNAHREVSFLNASSTPCQFQASPGDAPLAHGVLEPGLATTFTNTGWHILPPQWCRFAK